MKADDGRGAGDDGEARRPTRPQPQPLLRAGNGLSLGALVASAAQVLAPNSLQFNEHEFQQCVDALSFDAQYHDH